MTEDKMREALNIATAVIGDATERLRLFRDEPCDIPDIQHIAAIGVESLERAATKLKQARGE